MASNKTMQIRIVSEATGELALHNVNTILTQFPPGVFQVHLDNFINTERKWSAFLQKLKGEKGKTLVVHSIGNEQWKKSILETCKQHSIPEFDITGPLMDFLNKFAPQSAKPNWEKVHDMDEVYFRRIQAMEFTLDHDDGVLLEELHKADLVLTGVSRTSKTPISLFLANKGIKTANVPLAIETGIPPGLESYEGKNVVGLTILASRLQTIRETRERVDGIPPGTYSSREHVQKELRMANDLFRRKKWKTLDVSFASIEESAWKVIKLMDLLPL